MTTTHDLAGRLDAVKSRIAALSVRLAKADSFRPPQAVRDAARRGLELRRKWGRGGLSNAQASEQGIGSGVQRAADLAGGDAVSLDTIKRMVAFFDRHAKNWRPDKTEPDGGPTAGVISHYLWGAKAGERWARSVLRRASGGEKVSKHLDPSPVGLWLDHSGGFAGKGSTLFWGPARVGTLGCVGDAAPGVLGQNPSRGRGRGAALQGLVAHVPGVIRKEQVLDVQAPRVVAPMADAHAVRDRTAKGSPHDAVAALAADNRVIPSGRAVLDPSRPDQTAGVRKNGLGREKTDDVIGVHEHNIAQALGEARRLLVELRRADVVKAKDPAKTPAPPEDRVSGSDRNEPGSASGSRGGIDLPAATVTALQAKVAAHNDRHGEDAGKRATLGQLKAVWRRGAGAYSTSHRPGVSRSAWAMARVNAFLSLLRNGRPESAAYVTDNDLLPDDHPRAARKMAKAAPGGRFADAQHSVEVVMKYHPTARDAAQTQPAPPMKNLGLRFAFSKADATGRFVRGFASVIEVDGKTVEDTQGDVIDMAELTRAAHRFVSDARVAKAMHKGAAVGEVVESVLIDDEFAKTLGVTDTRRGWWIGMQVHDPKIQKRIASGELRAFSIGGSGRRTQEKR